jgi:thiosulfate/3-mercaptopyruvate sulfurtransferase
MNSTDEVADVKTPIAMLALLGAVVSHTATARPSEMKLRQEMPVSTAWLQEHLGDRDLVVLYVGRSRSDYDAGHIPGARFLPLDELVEQHPDSLNDLPPVASLQAVFESLGVGDESRVVLYGESGGLLAARAYFTLDYLGHGDRTSLLDGGMEKWAAESRPVDHQPVQAGNAHFTPHVQSEVAIRTPRMHEIVEAVPESYVLLDARPPREFDGTVMSEAVPKAGHLPGAKSLYWKTLLQSEAVPTLRDTAELRRAFEDAGATGDVSVVTYCRTGIQSSFTYFVAKYLGYRVAMYDGSVYEWVHRGGYGLIRSASAAKGDAK